MYWEDVKYCPHKKIFLPKEKCKDFEVKEEDPNKHVIRRSLYE